MHFILYHIYIDNYLFCNNHKINEQFPERIEIAVNFPSHDNRDYILTECACEYD